MREVNQIISYVFEFGFVLLWRFLHNDLLLCHNMYSTHPTSRRDEI